jgi:diadenosine tetraphosphate (Ap4A) HIT family hydrolase
MAQQKGCVLCETAGGVPVASHTRLRVIRAQEEGFPAFYRVVWTDHAPEFSDLEAADRKLCMEAVAAVELALRQHLPAQWRPDKINLAALGNMVPHLHWHVIARYGWDSRFPAPVWAPAVRTAPADKLAALEAALARAEDAMRHTLSTL